MAINLDELEKVQLLAPMPNPAERDAKVQAEQQLKARGRHYDDTDVAELTEAILSKKRSRRNEPKVGGISASVPGQAGAVSDTSYFSSEMSQAAADTRANKSTSADSAAAASRTRATEANRVDRAKADKAKKDGERLVRVKYVEQLTDETYRFSVKQGSIRLAQMAWNRIKDSGIGIELCKLDTRSNQFVFTANVPQMAELRSKGFEVPNVSDRDDIFNPKGAKMEKQAERIRESAEFRTAKWKDETLTQKQAREQAEKETLLPHGSRRKPGTRIDVLDVSEAEYRNAIGTCNGETEIEKWERYYNGYVPSDLNKLLYQPDLHEQANGMKVTEVPIDHEIELSRMEMEWGNVGWEQIGFNLLMLTAMSRFWASARELVRANIDPRYREQAIESEKQCDVAIKRVGECITSYKNLLKHFEKVEKIRREALKMMK